MNRNRHRSITIVAITAGALSGCASDGPIRQPQTEPQPVAEAAPGPAMAAADGLQFEPAARRPADPRPADPDPTPEAPADHREPAPRETRHADVLVEVFPHIRVNRAKRLVEFDGAVPIDAHHPESPLVFLEVVACARGTKEHEALVVTDAKPSEVHAALLLIGLEPGRPGSFRWEDEALVPVPPSGDPVQVSIVTRDSDGAEVETPAAAWIRHAETGALIGAAGDDSPGWVFAGSAFVTRGGQEMYDADGAGTLIGLATFGSETVAFTQMISPEASLQEPVWVAAGEAIPPFDTPVIVRLRTAAPPAEAGVDPTGQHPE